MARTRDPRPSVDTQQRRFPGQTNVHENRRIYEDYELSAAEVLVGINASPTSHAYEPSSAPPSASIALPPIYQAVQEHVIANVENDSSRPSSATTSASARRQNRLRDPGRFLSATAPSHDVDHGNAAANSIEDYGVTNENHGGFSAGDSGPSQHSEPVAQIEERRPEQRQQTEGGIKEIVNGDPMVNSSMNGKRKRKRGNSVSVAAIYRGQVDGVAESSSVNGVRMHANDGEVPGSSTQTQSEPQTPDPAAYTEQQTQNEVGGPANPKTEADVNGTNTHKSKARYFDQVIFGRWQIKTWYHSPYPISTQEEENASTSAAPGKHGGQPSSARVHPTKRGNAQGRHVQNGQEHNASPEKRMLWVCDRCFKYMLEGNLLELHSRFCNRMHPPGRKVYERGAHVIYEIDGAKDKLYCQNLSLFGKFFIDIKTVFYDCENFLFYVLTEGDRHQDHVIGFFSKEKISYDEYNLACIITFPPYQRMRYGMLMIEFSYYLSRKAGKLGTPERPLSELGLRTYLTFWTGALVQFFRRVLSIQLLNDIPRDQQRSIDDDLVRFVEAQEANGFRRRRKSGKTIGDNSIKNKIWESGLENEYNTRDAIAATNGANDALYSRMRWMRTSSNPDGSATTHVFARCMLEDIANATGIRTEDVAFTLHECGLLRRIQALDSEEMEEAIVISREMVEHVAQDFKVKSKMCMEVQYCKI